MEVSLTELLPGMIRSGIWLHFLYGLIYFRHLKGCPSHSSYKQFPIPYKNTVTTLYLYTINCIVLVFPNDNYLLKVTIKTAITFKKNDIGQICLVVKISPIRKRLSCFSILGAKIHRRILQLSHVGSIKVIILMDHCEHLTGLHCAS